MYGKKDVLRVWHIWHLSKKNEKNEDGLPLSLWESSAAMVNAYGGIILLGMKELDDETLQQQDESIKIREYTNGDENQWKRCIVYVIIGYHIRSQTMLCQFWECIHW